MKHKESKDKDFQAVKDEYHRYLEALNEKNTEYRKQLPDGHCKKIYDLLFLEAQNNKYTLKFSEIRKLTEMTKPTLSLHLKHLEERKFIIKKVETKYKTSYRINLIKVVKVCKIKKTITGKEKLELTDITKIGTGDSFIPMEPLVPISKSEETDNSKSAENTRKSRGHFKAHKNE